MKIWPFLAGFALAQSHCFSALRQLDAWENTYGIDLSDAVKASADWDQDGLTNRQEHDAGTNPWGVWKVVCVSDELGPSFTTSYGVSVNASGEVFGNGYFDYGTGAQNQRPVAWYWKEGGGSAVGPPNTFLSDASPEGVAVGCQSPGYGTWVGFRWDPRLQIANAQNGTGQPSYVLTSPDEILRKVNTAGDIIGWKRPVPGSNLNGWFIRYSGAADPPAPAVLYTGAYTPPFDAIDINEFGEVLGSRFIPEYGTYGAVLYYRNQLISTGLPSSASGNPVGALDYYYAEPGQLNDYGEFTGNYFAAYANADFAGTYFFNGDYSEILVAPRPAGGLQSNDLNNSGDVLLFGDPDPFLWNRGLHRKVRDLTLVPGSEVLPDALEPIRISDRRHILLNAYEDRGIKCYLIEPAQDSDGDGMSDDWEKVYGLNPHYAGDADRDFDGDGLTNGMEFQLRRNPLLAQGPGPAPASAARSFGVTLDADQDGIPDTWENGNALDPNDPADASLDHDHDGVSNLAEFQRGTSPIADPWLEMIAVDAPHGMPWTWTADGELTLPPSPWGASFPPHPGLEPRLSEDGSVFGDAVWTGQLWLPPRSALRSGGWEPAVSTPSPSLSARAVSPNGLSRYMAALGGWYAMPGNGLNLRLFSPSTFSKILAADDSGGAAVQGGPTPNGIRVGLAQRSSPAISWVDVPDTAATFGAPASIVTQQNPSSRYTIDRFVGIRGDSILEEASVTANLVLAGTTVAVTQKRPFVARPSLGAGALTAMTADRNLSFEAAGYAANGIVFGSAQMIPSGTPYAALWRSTSPSVVTPLPPPADLQTRWAAQGAGSHAQAANALGWMAGTQTLRRVAGSTILPSETVTHPVLWRPSASSPGAWTCLDLVPQAAPAAGGSPVNMPIVSASVKFINDCGEVLGTYARADFAPDSKQRFFFWKLGRFYDLQNLICNNTGYWIADLKGFNNAGEILATALHYRAPAPKQRLFILRTLTDVDGDLYLSDSETNRGWQTWDDYHRQLTALPVGAVPASIFNGGDVGVLPPFTGSDVEFHPPSFSYNREFSDLLVSGDPNAATAGGESLGEEDRPTLVVNREVSEISNRGPGIDVAVHYRRNAAVNPLATVDRVRVAFVNDSVVSEGAWSPTFDGKSTLGTIQSSEKLECASGMLDRTGLHDFLNTNQGVASAGLSEQLSYYSETHWPETAMRWDDALIFPSELIASRFALSPSNPALPFYSAESSRSDGYLNPSLNLPDPPLSAGYTMLGSTADHWATGEFESNQIVASRTLGREITVSDVLEEMANFSDEFSPAGGAEAHLSFPVTDYPLEGSEDFRREIVQTYGAHRRFEAAVVKKMRYSISRGGDRLPSDIVIWKERFIPYTGPNAFRSLNNAEDAVSADTDVWMWAKLAPGQTTERYLIDPSRRPFSQVRYDLPVSPQCGQTVITAVDVLNGALDLSAAGQAPLPRGTKTSPGLTVAVPAGYSGIAATLAVRPINMMPFYRGTYSILAKAPPGVTVGGGPLTAITAFQEHRYTIDVSSATQPPGQAIFSLYYTLQDPSAGIDFVDVLIDTVRLNLVPKNWIPNPGGGSLPDPTTAVATTSASGDLAIIAADGSSVRESDEENPGLIVPFSLSPAAGGTASTVPALPTLKVTLHPTADASSGGGSFKVVANGGTLDVVDKTPLTADVSSKSLSLKLTGPPPASASTTTFDLVWIDPSGTEHPGIDTVKVALVQVKLLEVSFGGPKYWELWADDCGALTVSQVPAEKMYSAPQWKDIDGNGTPTDEMPGERNYALAYTRNTKPTIGAKFNIQGASTYGTIRIRATGTGGMTIPETAGAVSGDDVALPLTEASSALATTVKYFDKKDDSKAFNLHWEVKIGNSNWSKMGATKHGVYVTMSDPTTALRQETLFEIGCRNADGKSTAAEVTTSIFGEFEDRVVLRATDRQPLTYYADWNNNSLCGSVSDLLKLRDGVCDAFAELFVKCRMAQGVGSMSEIKRIRSRNWGRNEGFATKNWAFQSTGTSGDPVYPYVNICPYLGSGPSDRHAAALAAQGAPKGGLPAVSAYRWAHVEVGDLAGGPGIGPVANPVSLFLAHAVVVIDGQIYDPSYGGSVIYNSLSEWEAASVSGFFVIDENLPRNEAAYSLDLNGDGDSSGVSIPAAAFKFRRNPAAQDMEFTPTQP